MHIPVFPPWIGNGYIFATCAAAFWKGGRDERIVAGAFLLDVAITNVIFLPVWHGTRWGEFAIDGAFLVVLAVVALRSKRYWPMAATAFQLLAVLTHAASVLDKRLGGWAYITADIIWTQMVTTSLAVGTYNRWRERRQPAIEATIAEPGATRL